MKPYKPGPFHFAKTKQDEEDLWAARKEALFTMVNTKAEGTILWTTDVAVPLSRLADIIGEASAALTSRPTTDFRRLQTSPSRNAANLAYSPVL
jgi:FAD/FMN-containing dehydrogenase